MKILTFQAQDGLRLGIKTTAGIVDVTESAQRANRSAPGTIMDVITGGETALTELADVLAVAQETKLEHELQLAPALPTPGKILCVGLNYRKHAVESKMPIPDYPVYFSKYNNCLTADRTNVVIPSCAKNCDYEVELVVVIGQKAKQVAPENALKYVFGYATGNDLSARDLQFRAGQWLYGKAIDGFAPLGPYLVTADEVPNPQALSLKCWHNGVLRQNSNTSDMIFSVAEVISDLSQIMTLEPGDIIYTGTPEGVIMGLEEKHWLQPGDEVVCEVEGLGKLANWLVSDVTTKA